mmetsp:Transcript_77213/g.184881  ORF Transcript_77213/g.184881 Transcript_77213/m.184881 type:complete len:298 (+) Transcript_77213:242-1135(+)
MRASVLRKRSRRPWQVLSLTASMLARWRSACTLCSRLDTSARCTSAACAKLLCTSSRASSSDLCKAEVSCAVFLSSSARLLRILLHFSTQASSVLLISSASSLDPSVLPGPSGSAPFALMAAFKEFSLSTELSRSSMALRRDRCSSCCLRRSSQISSSSFEERDLDASTKERWELSLDSAARRSDLDVAAKPTAVLDCHALADCSAVSSACCRSRNCSRSCAMEASCSAFFSSRSCRAWLFFSKLSASCCSERAVLAQSRVTSVSSREISSRKPAFLAWMLSTCTSTRASSSLTSAI